MARRVQTAAGAAYFGVGIGQLITPDMEDDAKARHGGRPSPPGSVTGSNQKRAGTKDGTATGTDKPATDAPNNSQSSETQSTDWASKGFTKPKLTGPVSVPVGKVKFSAPEGSEVFKSPNHPGRAYVVTPDNLTYVFTSSGELQLTPEESQALTEQVRSKFKAVGTDATEDTEKPVTWVRIKSLADLIEQAEKAGNTAQVEKLTTEFLAAVSSIAPESDPQTVKEQLKKATGSI